MKKITLTIVALMVLVGLVVAGVSFSVNSEIEVDDMTKYTKYNLTESNNKEWNETKGNETEYVRCFEYDNSSLDTCVRTNNYSLLDTRQIEQVDKFITNQEKAISQEEKTIVNTTTTIKKRSAPKL